MYKTYSLGNALNHSSCLVDSEGLFAMANEMCEEFGYYHLNP